MRTILVILALLLLTPFFALIIIGAELARARSGPGSIFDWCARTWARSMCVAAGAKIRVHNPEQMQSGRARVYVSNHVSWFDVFALASVLPDYTFIAKAELRRIPLFGRAARDFGIVFIERTNRKAAFDSYREAGAMVSQGKSVVVYPEGTRGFSYELRPFKKGPFVLAISAGVPIVPTIVHGAREIQPKGSLRIRPGRIDIHLLEPVPTAGLSYEERDDLMRTVWKRMAIELQEQYGVESHSGAIVAESRRPKIPTSFL